LQSKNRSALCVYNLNKDKTLYCVTYKKNDSRESRLKNHPDEYSYILANSFVVIYKIVKDIIYIYLVDLLSEKVHEFRYTLYDYLKRLSNLVNNETDKKRLNAMLSSEDLKIIIDKYHLLIWDVEHVECILDNNEGTVPFIKFLKLYFRIDQIASFYKRVDNALLVSFSFENNDLSIQFATGKEGTIERKVSPTFKITIPSDVVLFRKKYNLDTSYDISKSYPYYIYKVTQNYIFTRRHVFEQSPRKSHEYILNHELSNLYERDNLYTTGSINVLRTRNNIMAQIDDNYSEHKLGVHIIGADFNTNPKLVTFIDLHKIISILQKGEYIDISNYTFDVNIHEKIMNAMGIKKEEVKSIESRISYHFLLDATIGLLYILIRLLPRYRDDNDGEYWLCKCRIRHPESHCEVVAIIHSYKSKETKNFINIAKNNLHLLEVMNKNIYNERSNYLKHGRAYIYNEGVMVVNDILSVKIKDIRQNRISVLQYIEELPKIKTLSWEYNVYQNNFLFLDSFIQTQNGNLLKFYYPLVFTDLKLVRSIRIRRIARH